MCTADDSDRVVVPIGQSVTLNCSTSQPIEWFYQRSENSLAKQICSAGAMVNGFEADNKYFFSKTNPADKGLVIKNFTVEETGIYSCRDTKHGVLRILHLKVSGTIIISLY